MVLVTTLVNGEMRLLVRLIKKINIFLDIGNTTYNGLKALGETKKNDVKICKLFNHIATDKLNSVSESNGCLMRITPLAVWCQNLPDDQLY